MRSTIWSSVIFAVFATWLTCGWAQSAPRPAKAVRNGKTPIDEFMRMPPEERQKALDRLPPAKRARLEERLQKFNQLPPRQQQNLRNMYDRLNQLPPERQQMVRKSIQQFSQQPPDRRRAIRQELRDMAPLADADREARMNSPEFRERFSRKEQRIVRDMSEVLPTR